MTPALSIATAVTFGWLGMVLAISFLEAPLKFRAPGVTVPIGLGIGRLVFRALNATELLLGLVVAGSVLIGRPSRWTSVVLLAAVVLLLVQLLAVRPPLNRRSDRILAGEQLPHSPWHLTYAALETVKVIALLVGGIALLAG